MLKMIQPLAILVLAYTWVRYKDRPLRFLVVSLVLIQVVIGFIVDIKGEAMLGGVLVIATLVFVDGRLPKLWLVSAAAFVVLGFPVFQAHHIEAPTGAPIIRKSSRIWSTRWNTRSSRTGSTRRQCR